jgi:Uma2 family endonuclease
VTTTAPPPPRPAPARRFANAAEWLRALGNVPLERIIFDPLPGTATEQDLLLLVERDKRLCELVDGTLVEKPVGLVEAVIALNLAIELGGYVKRAKLGVVSGADSTLRMVTGRVRLPDFSFFSFASLPGGALPREPIPTLTPDLAVEVLSDSNTPAEIDQKLREYFQGGTRLAWVIDPSTRTVAIYHGQGKPAHVLAESGVLDGEHVVRGFSMPVVALFENVPRP